MMFQEPIKEAGILEGRNGIKETCLQVHQIAIMLMGYGVSTLHNTSIFDRHKLVPILTEPPASLFDTRLRFYFHVYVKCLFYFCVYHIMPLHPLGLLLM